MLDRPSPTVTLAARHLDLTEGRMGVPGHVVDDSDRSAIETVLRYVSAQHNAPKTSAPVAAPPPVKTLHDAAKDLAANLDRLERAGYVVYGQTDSDHLRVGLKGDGAGRVWFEVGNPHGNWDVLCASGSDASKASSDVALPFEAYAKLIKLARQSVAMHGAPFGEMFTGLPSHVIGAEALVLLAEAGLIPAESCSAAASETVPNNLEKPHV